MRNLETIPKARENGLISEMAYLGPCQTWSFSAKIVDGF